MSRQDTAPGASAAIGAALYGLATRAARRLPRDMSLTSAATLATLDRTGPRRITDLAAVEGVTQPAMTTLVRVMEESGLVERWGDASDKRVTLVSLGSAQWTLTVALLSGAVATPVLGRLGAGPHRRATILATLAVVVAGSALTVLPLPFAWLLAGRAAQGVGLGLTALMMGVARD